MPAVLDAPIAAPYAPAERNGADSAPPGLFEKAVCLVLSLSKLGNRRTLSTALVEVDADKELISVKKTLLSSSELKAIEHFDAEIRRFLVSRCLPSLFAAGTYLVPIPLVEEVDARLVGLSETRDRLVNDFAAVYPALVAEARGRLRSAFSYQDYPCPEDLTSSFRMQWRYVAFSVPGRLEGISAHLFHKEQEKAARLWQEALEEVRTLLRSHLADMVHHLVERLGSNGPDGKPKIFKSSLVTNLTTFLETFDARNLSDDTELAEVVGRARSLLGGVDAQGIRSSQELRSSLCTGFAGLQTTLDSLVVTKPVRAFNFADE